MVILRMTSLSYINMRKKISNYIYYRKYGSQDVKQKST